VKILLVEDDVHAIEVLMKALTAQHYLVDLATNGQAGWELAEAFAYDLILLGVMLPKIDGIGFCKWLRAKRDRTPIILLIDQDTISSKVTGLDAGADDYVVKPLDLHELLAKIRALLRRGSSTSSPLLEWGSLRLDPSSCKVTYDRKLLHFTAKEYALLELFLRNTHRIFSQSALLDHLWSFDEPPSENTVRAHIKSLRQKLKKAGAQADLIETIYGLGYRLKPRELVVGNQESETVHSSSPSCYTATEAGQACQQTTPELIAIWEQLKERYTSRIAVLERAVTAARKGTLSEELRQQALGEAHTLVGSLGSFGFDKVACLSREFEQMFQTEERLNQAQVEHASRLVVALRQKLTQLPATLEPQVPRFTPVKQQCRLLIVDDDAEMAEQLISEATAWGMRVEVATDLSQAREAIARAQMPALKISD